MGDGGLRVFISSTGERYLQQYRTQAVEACHRLGLQPIAMEEFSPESPPPLDVCTRRVREANVFICIVGHRYGSRPPGSPKSFTEHEYESARAMGIPMHIYVVDRTLAWPPTEIDEGEDRRRLEVFKKRLTAEHTIRRFGDVHTFREDVLVFLGNVKSSAQLDDVPRESAPKAVGRKIPRPPDPHYVPRYVSRQPFIGRYRELQIITEWANSEDNTLLVHAIGGNGKSALVWEWSEHHAEEAFKGLAGRFWWSFYEGAASMDAFLTELTRYLTGWTAKRVHPLSALERLDEIMSRLHARPFVLILDGFERLLRAYHRLDAGSLRDDEVDESARSLINHQEADIVRQLARCAPSKVLVSTRLVPKALENVTRDLIPGVRAYQLDGLSNRDTLRVLERLAVKGDPRRMMSFFERLGNHPLLLGIVAGLIRDYRTSPGNFDRWVSDSGAGGALRLGELDIVQRRSHILAAAMNGLHPAHRLLLGGIAELPTSIPLDFETLKAISPFEAHLPSGDRVFAELFDLEELPSDAERLPDGLSETLSPDEVAATWAAHVEGSQNTSTQLDAALTDLEDRGLLWWDRATNLYSLHPVVRAFAQDQLDGKERVEVNERIRDHFSALPGEEPDDAASVDDLRQTIAIFTALLRASRMEEAMSLFRRRLHRPLLYRLGAYSTVAELMEPFLARDFDGDSRAFALNEAGIVKQRMGHVAEGQTLKEDSLRYVLDAHDSRDIAIVLANISKGHEVKHEYIAAQRCLELADAVTTHSEDEAMSNTLLLDRTWLLCSTGQVVLARTLFTHFDRRMQPGVAPVPPTTRPEVVECNIALREGTLTEETIERASAVCVTADDRLHVLWLKRAMAREKGDLEAALAYAEEQLAFARTLGVGTPNLEGSVAFQLAELNRLDEARILVEEAVAASESLYPTLRPYLAAARIMWRCGFADAGSAYALKAYGSAWGDGGRYSAYWDLQSVRSLLQEIEIPEPHLPTIDPASVRLPFEQDVQSYLEDLQRPHPS